MIRLKAVVKQYGLNPVLRGVDLAVEQGEFVTLVGPNGAGKSTLLSIIATLLRPSSGDVSVGGWRLPEQAARVRRHIGLVSHHSLLYRDLTAAENLAFFARLYRLDDAGDRVADALRQVGLLARQRDPVGTFSRGMIQRLTIARATLHEPDVLLLDEPYTGLDQEATALLDDLLRAETARGRTILMITHDLGHGLGLADRLAILYGGRVAHEVRREDISAAAVYDLYADVTMGG
ncbi:MAG: heme ABC exporter ATP-binding protein CcmA [Candidatus Promineofilum sp.]|nr:heme ABC exporter ATP-binding protein CcmA [Promineifilum sp.]